MIESTHRIRAKEQSMAFINYITEEKIPLADRVPDHDNIIRIHGVHSQTMRQHYDLYKELMYGKSPLSRIQREMIAVVVSAENRCRY
jgi:alkylhydroperoxidase family enzyme